MNTKEHTRGLILGSLPRGEASKLVYIFTRDFGLIACHAQGVRKAMGKLKGFLEPYRYVDVSLVSGKIGCRIVDAHPYALGQTSTRDEDKLKLLARLCVFLKRFLGEDDPSPRLFDEMLNALIFLHGADLSGDEQSKFEMLAVTLVLYHLGYLPDKKHFEERKDFLLPLVESHLWDKDRLYKIHGRERELVTAINDSFQASQL